MVGWPTAVELSVCEDSDVVCAIQRLNVIPSTPSVKFPIRQVKILTLEMACNVTENGWVTIYVQSLDTLILPVFADLVFEEPCKVRGCC